MPFECLDKFPNKVGVYTFRCSKGIKIECNGAFLFTPPTMHPHNLPILAQGGWENLPEHVFCGVGGGQRKFHHQASKNASADKSDLLSATLNFSHYPGFLNVPSSFVR